MQFKLKDLRNNDKANKTDGCKSCFVLAGDGGFMTWKMNCDKELRGWRVKLRMICLIGI